MSVSPLSSPSSQLNQVLQNYRLFSMNDLRGPASASALLINAEMAKLAAHLNLSDSYKYKVLESLQQPGKELPLPLGFNKPSSQLSTHTNSVPFLMRADSRYVQSEAMLEDQLIACFEIGGEKRLCLPQILKTVLSGSDLDHINQACDKLFIYCARCNDEQIDLLRKTRNLPPNAATCGLITMTDAERLCTDLLHSSNDSQNNYMSTVTDVGLHPKPSESCIPVYHECFGEGSGFLKPELYCSPDAPCIECTDCGRLFSTKRFVGHSHRNSENQICHWGFDRNNWRAYLLLAEEVITDDVQCTKLTHYFQELLDRFSAGQSQETSFRKRKIEPARNEEDEKAKLRRFSDSQLPLNQGLPNGWMLTSPPFTFPTRANGNWSAFPVGSEEHTVSTTSMKARLPTQKSCPPTLENPDRVVPSCESNRYEKHFVPNIALQQGNELEEADERSNDDIESVQSVEKELDRQSKTSSESCPPNDSISNSSTDAEGSQTTISVLENLARMENLYMQLLQASRSLNSNEKNTMEQKYISCSDSIRRHILPGGSSVHDGCR